MVGGGKHSININQLYTSGREGPSLGEMERVWEEVAVSEARIRMMDRLAIHNIGFNDVEHFNLGLVFNSKMMDQENPTDKNDRKIVEAAMKFKDIGFVDLFYDLWIQKSHHFYDFLI